MTDLETAIEYYKDLLLYQYINLPKARATIGLLVSQALVDLLPMQISAAFDLDTAEGPQLDILGEYIGLDRYVAAVVDREYFSMDDYVSPLAAPFGFTDYTDPAQNADATTYSYFNYNNDTALDDAEYRILLKLKAMINVSNFSMFEITTMLYAAFGDNIVAGDCFGMKMTYFVSTEYARIVTIARNENLLPKPMGVDLLGLFQMIDPASIWALTSYGIESGASVAFSSYSAWATGEILDYGDSI